MLVVCSPGDHEIFCSYVGMVADDLELQLGLLKTATLLKEIKGKEVTKERILQAIQKLNTECSGRLGQFLKTKVYRSQNPETVSDVPIYCEDPRLALEAPGLRYKAFRVPEQFDPVPVSRHDLELFIACAASFLDMTSVTFPDGKQGPARKKAFASLMDARAKFISKL